MKRIFTNMKRIFTIVIIPTAVSAIISFILQYTDTLQDVFLIPGIISFLSGLLCLIFIPDHTKDEDDNLFAWGFLALSVVSYTMNF